MNGRSWARLLACGLLGLAVGLLCARGTAQQASPPARHTPPPAIAYAGDAACAACHAKEARTYAETPHARDSGVADRKNILGDFTPGKNALPTAKPNVILAMIEAPDGFYQSAVNIADPQNLTGEAQRFDIVLGSGRRGQTYLYWQGDQLFELPVSYWTYTHQWINSPGYADGGVHFDRPILPRCLECHANTFQTAGPPANRYQKESLVLGIGCEKCHGPGAEHVAREKSAHPPAAGSPEIAIVNPARLVRDRQLDICALCHAGAADPIGPSMAFRPGDVITDYLKIVTPPPDAPVDVHGNQVNALKVSRCFTSGKLSCSTCHNVHTTQQAADAFSGKCLQCHEPRSCPRSRRLGQAIVGHCVACHMPEGKSTKLTATSGGELMQAIIRTHRIAVYPEAAAQEEAKLSGHAGGR